MTCIAWDGKTLAADKLAGDQWTKFGITTKIHRVGGHLVGLAGIASLNREMLSWFAAGAKPEDFPARQKVEADCSSMLVVNPDGSHTIYQAGPFPMLYESRYAAIGSGKEAAAAVMELGFGAKKAVEIASRVCAGCGNGMDVLELT